MAQFVNLHEDTNKNIVLWVILLAFLLVVGWYLLVRDERGVFETGTKFTREEKTEILQALSEQSRKSRLSLEEKRAILENLSHGGSNGG